MEFGWNRIAVDPGRRHDSILGKKGIGVEAFGILTLIWSLIGYFSLFDFWLGRALTQRVAASLASEDIRAVPHIVSPAWYSWLIPA